MSYTPTIWANGDTLDETDLNKIENGIAAASGGMVVEFVYDDGIYLNKTFTEIYTALKSKTPCYLYYEASGAGIGVVDDDIDDNYHVVQRLAPIIAAYKYGDKYRVMVEYFNSADFGVNARNVGAPALITFGADSIDGRLQVIAMVGPTYDSLTYVTYLPF